MHLKIIYGVSKVDPKPYGLMEYADSNYANNLKDKKLVMSYCFFINRAVVSWCSKKQQMVSISNIKAKYIVLGHEAKENIWIRRFLNELKITKAIGAYTLCGDNKTSIILIKNVESQT